MNAKRRAASLLLGVILAGCGGTPDTPGPTGRPVQSPQAITSLAPPVEPATLRPTPTLTPPPTPIPTLGPVVAAQLPVHADRGGARVILDPNGVPYIIAPVIAALDEAGRPREGWPVDIPGAYVEAADFDADGTLYLSLVTEGGRALTALGPDGRVRAGWPVAIPFREFCSRPLRAADGSIRLVCTSSPGWPAENAQAFAFDRLGRPLAGWPVDLTGVVLFDPLLEAGTTYGRPFDSRPVVLGTALLGVQQQGDWVRRFAVAADGTVRLGQRVAAPPHSWPCLEQHPPGYTIGPDGTVYTWFYKMNGCRFISTSYLAFDERGIRDGWPVAVTGESSQPTLGPDGRIYATRGSQNVLGARESLGSVDGRPTRIVAFDANGQPVPGWPVTLDVAPTLGWGGEWDWPPAKPSVGQDGTVYLITEDRGTTIYALDPNGNVLPGWPYRDADVFAAPYRPPTTGSTGGGHPVIVPLIDAAGRVHVVHWGWVTLVEGGRTAPGWPVTLRRQGSVFIALDVDPAGITYVLASELEGRAATGADGSVSETLLAIGLDGTVLYRTTLLEPGS